MGGDNGDGGGSGIVLVMSDECQGRTKHVVSRKNQNLSSRETLEKTNMHSNDVVSYSSITSHESRFINAPMTE